MVATGGHAEIRRGANRSPGTAPALGFGGKKAAAKATHLVSIALLGRCVKGANLKCEGRMQVPTGTVRQPAGEDAYGIAVPQAPGEHLHVDANTIYNVKYSGLKSLLSYAPSRGGRAGTLEPLSQQILQLKFAVPDFYFHKIGTIGGQAASVVGVNLFL